MPTSNTLAPSTPAPGHPSGSYLGDNPVSLEWDIAYNGSADQTAAIIERGPSGRRIIRDGNFIVHQCMDERESRQDAGS